MATLKQRIFNLIETPHAHNTAGRAFDMAMIVLIALNLLAVILESVAELYREFKPLFEGFEYFSIAVFTIEYALRLWVCTLHPAYRHPLWGRLRFALRPMALIDLLSFLPFYLDFMALDLRFGRALRLFRLFRVLKLSRFSNSMVRLGEVIKARKEELGITLFAGFLLLIIASSIMYFIEREFQPEVFDSIPSAMWWAVATLTTVGYGDIYPKTVIGKIVGSLIAVLGIGLFALPAGIIASGFITELQKKPQDPEICPHCGKPVRPQHGEPK